MTEVDATIANLDGEAALPRKNGELVFQAPWEGRAFGLAVALNEKRAYPWNDFRARLVGEIAGGNHDYYENWLGALESLLIARGVVSEDEVRGRASEYKALKRDPVF
jgi:nitrile hydratase accessory protein